MAGDLYSSPHQLECEVTGSYEQGIFTSMWIASWPVFDFMLCREGPPPLWFCRALKITQPALIRNMSVSSGQNSSCLIIGIQGRLAPGENQRSIFCRCLLWTASIESLVSSNLGGLEPFSPDEIPPNTYVGMPTWALHTHWYLFFNLLKHRTTWYLGHFAAHLLGFQSWASWSLWWGDPLHHSGYTGLWTVWLGSHRGSWKLKTNGMCLRLAEVTLKHRQAAGNYWHLSSGRERWEHDTRLLKLGPPPLSLQRQNLGSNLTAKCSWEKEKCVEFCFVKWAERRDEGQKEGKAGFLQLANTEKGRWQPAMPLGHYLRNSKDRHSSWLLLIIFNYLGKACVKQRPTKSRQAAEPAVSDNALCIWPVPFVPHGRQKDLQLRSLT